MKARFVDATGAGQRVAEATVESSILGGVSVRRIEYIPATAMDNPHITRDYIVELEQKPKALRDALLLGKWDAFDGQAFRSLWTIRRITRTGYTRTSSNRSKFHGTGRGWSASTTDIRGLFLLAFGRWTRRTGLPIQGALRLRAGEANVGVTCPPGEIARQLADLMEPEFEEGIHVSGIADPAIWDRSRGLSVEEQIRKVFNGVIFMKGDNTRLPGKDAAAQ